ncbi:unnamed protein product [Linum tenue]|uniref:GDSL esterase/lipase n=1 Tax=Linum tenue TaxID=586396 RepID=A0AAV0LHP6_9ROSI|nr:unnamed protein product [Linum tenue]
MAAHSPMAKMLGPVAVVGLAILGCSLLVQVGASPTPPYDSVPLCVFGDSYSDFGNNIYLDTTVRADYPPYGIDSPTGRPTGRFSNYRNMADYLSVALGLPETPSPYLSPQLSGERLLYCANFASPATGILNDTGVREGNRITMPEQLASFRQYRSRLAGVVGGNAQAERLINRAVFFVTVGTWDFLFNYYRLPFSARASQYPVLTDFIAYLISVYTNYLRSFYQLGARRVMIVGVGPLGCVPATLAARSRNGDCDPELQRAALLFNAEVVKMAQNLNSDFGGVFFLAADTNRVINDLYTNAAAYGFTETRVACCGQGRYNGEGQCTPASNLCPNRDVYVNWDPIHLTDRANGIIVQLVLAGPPEVISPMNLNAMLAMDNGA